MLLGEAGGNAVGLLLAQLMNRPDLEARMMSGLGTAGAG